MIENCVEDPPLYLRFLPRAPPLPLVEVVVGTGGSLTVPGGGNPSGLCGCCTGGKVTGFVLPVPGAWVGNDTGTVLPVPGAVGGNGAGP